MEELKEGTGPKVKQDNLAGITMRECAWARIALRRTFLPTPPLSLKWTANSSNDAVARKVIASCASPHDRPKLKEAENQDGVSGQKIKELDAGHQTRVEKV